MQPNEQMYQLALDILNSLNNSPVAPQKGSTQWKAMQLAKWVVAMGPVQESTYEGPDMSWYIVDKKDE